MLTETLSEFVVSTRTADIADLVFAKAEAGVIDTLGCALAGLREEVVHLARNWVEWNGSAQSAAIWGTAQRASTADAAFINAIAAHALDFDDNLPSLRGHPSTTAFPVALAVAETTGASGAEMLAAYAIAIEITGKLGRAMGYGHYARGWHPTATMGIFGATAAAARLLRLDPGQLAHAWGLAASQMAGLVMNFGTMTKPFHAGHAARCAVASAKLAQLGLSANPRVFDGDKNILAIYCGDGDPLPQLVPKLGAPWEVVDPGLYVKRWPCCFCSHRPISALLSLLERHDVKPDEVQEIAVGFPPGSDSGLISELPSTGTAGKFSIEYTLAAAVLDRKVALDSFTDSMVRRPEAGALMAKVRRYQIPDSRTWSATDGYNDISILSTRGHFQMRIDRTPGSPDFPLDPAALDSKFLDCATPVLGNRRAERVLQACRKLRDGSEVRELTESLAA